MDYLAWAVIISMAVLFVFVIIDTIGEMRREDQLRRDAATYKDTFGEYPTVEEMRGE